MEDQQIIEILGDEYSDKFSIEENLYSIVAEIKHFRKLSRIVSFFIKKVSSWLEEEIRE